jgi:hypothetical protein
MGLSWPLSVGIYSWRIPSSPWFILLHSNYYHLTSFIYMLLIFYFCLSFWGVGLDFELRTSFLQSRCSNTWAILPVYFCSGYFGDGLLRTVCPGCPKTTILLISASQVARITGMSHQHPATHLFYFFIVCLLFLECKLTEYREFYFVHSCIGSWVE